jgi:hypothetical protein
MALGGVVTQTGDLNLLNGIGAQGIQSSDFASIYTSMAESERIREDQRRADSQRNLIIFGGAAWVTILIVIIMVYLNKRQRG